MIKGHFFPHGYPIFTPPVVEKSILSPLNCFSNFVNSWLCMYGSISESILCSIYLYLIIHSLDYCIFIISLEVWYCTFFNSCFWVVLAILGLLPFYINCRISLQISIKIMLGFSFELHWINRVYWRKLC